MTKKRGIFSKLFFSVVMLTLISCCFLGSTFARYTSGRSGTATIQVAEWKISDGEGFVDIETNQLSPSKKEYEETNGTNEARSHSTGRILVATIKNEGEVGAMVTLTTGDTVDLTKLESATYADGTTGHTIEALDGNPLQTEVEALFSIKLYVNTTTDSAVAATEYGNGDYANGIELEAKTGVAYIYAELTWTSADRTYYEATTNHAHAESLADALDTWVGENITEIGFEVSYTAVQNTERPGAGA